MNLYLQFVQQVTNGQKCTKQVTLVERFPDVELVDGARSPNRNLHTSHEETAEKRRIPIIQVHARKLSSCFGPFILEVGLILG